MSFRSMKLELMSFLPELNGVQAGIRINRAYEHLLDAHTWSFLQTEGLVQTVGLYTTGTVTTTLGSTSVVGSGTAFTSSMIGRYIKIFGALSYYKITNVVGQVLTLETSYGEAGATDAGYSIFQHLYTLPTDCGAIKYVKYDDSIGEKTADWLAIFDPNLESTGQPVYYSRFSDTQMQLWPVPDQAYTIRIGYVKLIAQLSAETDVALIPERLILTQARMNGYEQSMERAEGQNAQKYQLLITSAKADMADLWKAAIEKDLAQISTPHRVLQPGIDCPYSDDFLTSHDTYDPRGG